MTKAETLIKLIEDSYRVGQPLSNNRVVAMRVDSNSDGQFWEVFGSIAESTNKTLYKGVFYWHGESIVVYKHAFSDKQAKYLMLTDVANKTGYDINAIRNIYSDKNKYKIEINK